MHPNFNRGVIKGHVHMQGAVIVGILFVTFIAWIPGHAASWLGTKSQLLGECRRPTFLSPVLLKVLSSFCDCAEFWSGGSGSIELPA